MENQWENLDPSIKEVVVTTILTFAKMHKERLPLLKEEGLLDQEVRTERLIWACYNAKAKLFGGDGSLWDDVLAIRKEMVFYELFGAHNHFAKLAEAQKTCGLCACADRSNEVAQAHYIAALFLGYEPPKPKGMWEIAGEKVADMASKATETAVKAMLITATWKADEPDSFEAKWEPLGKVIDNTAATAPKPTKKRGKAKK